MEASGVLHSASPRPLTGGRAEGQRDARTDKLRQLRGETEPAIWARALGECERLLDDLGIVL